MGSNLFKGTIYLTLAQIFFIATGYFIHIIVARYLGPSLYGLFGIVMSILILSQIILIEGIPRALSKYLAESHIKAISILRQGLKLQYIASITLTILLIFSAKFIANALNDPSLTIYIILVSFSIIPQSIISVYSKGFLNGVKKFREQSFVNTFNSIFKITFVFLFVVLFKLKIVGVLFAYIFASIFTLVLSVYFVKKYIKNKNLVDSGDKFHLLKIVKFSIPVIILYSVYLLIMNMDILFVKTILGDNAQVGFYTAANTLSRVPYFFFSSLSLTLLPSISTSMAKNDRKRIKKYINFSLRNMVLLLLPLIFLVSATSKNTISLFYGSSYLPGAQALSILIFGLSFLSIFSVMSIIIVASGKPKIAMIFALMLLPIYIILSLVLIPLFKLNGAPLATLITMSFGLLIVSCYIIKRFKTLMSPLSFLRILISSLIIYFISLRWQFSGIFIVFTYGIMFLLFVGLLILMGEIRKKDILEIKRYLSK